MNDPVEWMFNDTPAQSINQLLGVKKNTHPMEWMFNDTPAQSINQLLGVEKNTRPMLILQLLKMCSVVANQFLSRPQLLLITVKITCYRVRCSSTWRTTLWRRCTARTWSSPTRGSAWVRRRRRNNDSKTLKDTRSPERWVQMSIN